jgi:hypothetical protein
MPVSANATLLYVDFEGYVTSSSNPEYSVGDPFAESLIIDTDLAPPDFWDDDPTDGHYEIPVCDCDVDFVFGTVEASDAPGYERDYVIVHRFESGSYPGVYSTYQIANASGFGTEHYRELVFQASLSNLVRNDDLIQSFEVTSTEGLSRVSGALWTGGFSMGVLLAATRFSVTPTPGQFTCSR